MKNRVFVSEEFSGMEVEVMRAHAAVDGTMLGLWFSDGKDGEVAIAVPYSLLDTFAESLLQAITRCQEQADAKASAPRWRLEE